MASIDRLDKPVLLLQQEFWNEPEMNLNQVTLPATDIQQSGDFYKRLGFNQIVDSPHYSRFECPDGEATFSIHLAVDFTPCESYVTYFEIEELDQFVDRKISEGFQFDRMPDDMRWKWREARLRDPAGNVICLYWAGKMRKNPPWRVN